MAGKLQHDLTGKRYGRLLVARYHGMKDGELGRNYWVCVCDCGKTTLVDSFSLRTERIHSCGCGKQKYHRGDKVGEFTLVHSLGKGMWQAECSCGTFHDINPGSVLKRTKHAMCSACAGKNKKRKDLTGRTFGHLTALRCVGTDKHRNAIWLLQCRCGNRVQRRINELQKTRVRGTHSCGTCTGPYRSHTPRSHEHLIAKE